MKSISRTCLLSIFLVVGFVFCISTNVLATDCFIRSEAYGDASGSSWDHAIALGEETEGFKSCVENLKDGDGYGTIYFSPEDTFAMKKFGMYLGLGGLDESHRVVVDFGGALVEYVTKFKRSRGYPDYDVSKIKNGGRVLSFGLDTDHITVRNFNVRGAREFIRAEKGSTNDLIIENGFIEFASKAIVLHGAKECQRKKKRSYQFDCPDNSSSDIRIRNIVMKGISKKAVELDGVRNVIIENIDVSLIDRFGNIHEGDEHPQLITIQGRSSDILIDGVRLDHAIHLGNLPSHHNGDGITAEHKTQRITVRNSVIRHAMDGCIDLKGGPHYVKNNILIDCNRAIRFWGVGFAKNNVTAYISHEGEYTQKSTDHYSAFDCRGFCHVEHHTFFNNEKLFTFDGRSNGTDLSYLPLKVQSGKIKTGDILELDGKSAKAIVAHVQRGAEKKHLDVWLMHVRHNLFQADDRVVTGKGFEAQVLANNSYQCGRAFLKRNLVYQGQDYTHFNSDINQWQDKCEIEGDPNAGVEQLGENKIFVFGSQDKGPDFVKSDFSLSDVESVNFKSDWFNSRLYQKRFGYHSGRK